MPLLPIAATALIRAIVELDGALTSLEETGKDWKFDDLQLCVGQYQRLSQKLASTVHKIQKRRLTLGNKTIRGKSAKLLAHAIALGDLVEVTSNEIRRRRKVTAAQNHPELWKISSLAREPGLRFKRLESILKDVTDALRDYNAVGLIAEFKELQKRENSIMAFLHHHMQEMTDNCVAGRRIDRNLIVTNPDPTPSSESDTESIPRGHSTPRPRDAATRPVQHVESPSGKTRQNVTRRENFARGNNSTLITSMESLSISTHNPPQTRDCGQSSGNIPSTSRQAPGSSRLLRFVRLSGSSPMASLDSFRPGQIATSRQQQSTPYNSAGHAGTSSRRRSPQPVASTSRREWSPMADTFGTTPPRNLARPHSTAATAGGSIESLVDSPYFAGTVSNSGATMASSKISWASESDSEL
ncbi:hypothetical protein C8R47DRAFT_1120825 [Mycena vitilis]|nr:hypothetical protein C8R47DRAFT_1120825 [Mycena vitilis]